MVQVSSEKVLKSAPPPWHAVLFVVLVTTFMTTRLPKMLSSFDDETTKQAIVSPLFEDLLDKRTLGWIRIVFAIVIFCIFLISIRGGTWVNLMKLFTNLDLSTQIFSFCLVICFFDVSFFIHLISEWPWRCHTLKRVNFKRFHSSWARIKNNFSSQELHGI